MTWVSSTNVQEPGNPGLELTKSRFLNSSMAYPLRLSQTQLNLLSECPRKFQHTYLEQLAIASDPDYQEKRRLGEQFHQLMQQYYLGLSVAPLLAADPLLSDRFAAFIQSEPALLPTATDKVYQSECSRSLELEGYLLTVVYDLLVCGPETAQILDWKTYAKPQQLSPLQNNWQSRLYPFVLAETSSYRPEQISMTYWFFQATAAGEPQKLHIPYTKALHDQTHAELRRLLPQLNAWLTQYNQGVDLPQVPLGSRHCATCSFAIRCDRLAPSTQAPTTPLLLSDVAAIPEIPI